MYICTGWSKNCYLNIGHIVNQSIGVIAINEWWSQIWQWSYFWHFNGWHVYVCGLRAFTKKAYKHLNWCSRKMFVFPRMAESAWIMMCQKYEHHSRECFWKLKSGEKFDTLLLVQKLKWRKVCRSTRLLLKIHKQWIHACMGSKVTFLLISLEQSPKSECCGSCRHRLPFSCPCNNSHKISRIFNETYHEWLTIKVSD